MDKQDILEKVIVSAVMIGIFLPARLVFSVFIDNWIGNLGLISTVGILLFFLVRKNKLGRLGKIIENQITKTVFGRAGKIAIIFGLFFILYFGSTLIFIDRGNTVYLEDKELFYLVFSTDHQINEIPANAINGPTQISKNLQYFSILEYSFSIAYALINDVTDQWFGHFIVVLLVEQIEVLGLLAFYRHKIKRKLLEPTKVFT